MYSICTCIRTRIISLPLLNEYEEHRKRGNFFFIREANSIVSSSAFLSAAIVKRISASKVCRSVIREEKTIVCMRVHAYVHRHTSNWFSLTRNTREERTSKRAKRLPLLLAELRRRERRWTRGRREREIRGTRGRRGNEKGLCVSPFDEREKDRRRCANDEEDGRWLSARREIKRRKRKPWN